MEVAVTECTLVNGYNVREEACRICKNYLGGAWDEIDSSSIIIRKIKGGCINHIYYCSVPDEKRTCNSVPNEVLLRIFGTLTKENNDVIRETICFISLAEERIGPQLYGVFPGGRLEEFIPGNSLTQEKALEPNIYRAIAKRLAKIHSLHLPLNKDPSEMFQTLKRYSLIGRKNFKPEDWNERERINAQFVLSYNIEAEADWCSDFLKNLNLPKAFSHNDVRPDNIILRNSNSQNLEDELFFVDVEFSSYNYRGHDFAELFCQRCFDFPVSEYPHYIYKKEKYPTKEDQLLFIRSYLESIKCGIEKNNEVDTEEHILKEIEVLRLPVHLILTLRVCAFVNPIDEFGIWDFAKLRLELYFEEKKKLLDKMKKEHVIV